jgi:hypothetical protein
MFDFKLFMLIVIICKRIFFRNVVVKWLVTSRGLASVGDLVSQMYRIKNQLPSTKPTLKFA